MRLDKFLKVSRIIRRRTIAKEVCDQGGASVNGRASKAGTELKTGDVLDVRLGNKLLRVRVLSTPDAVRAQDAQQLYEVIEEKTEQK